MIDFKKLRFDEAHHLGLGDIRITIGQQQELEEERAELEAENAMLRIHVEEVEAENAELKKAIKFEQTLREEYHNEETSRLRSALAAVARHAIEVNKPVDDQPQE